MLKVSQVAERLNCSIGTVYQLVESKRLPHFRCPGIRVSEEQLVEYLASCRNEVAQRFAPKPQRVRFEHYRR